MYDLGYSRPATLAKALELLQQDDLAQLVSGGQTLMPVLRARLAAPSQLVDIARLDDLRQIRTIGAGIEIGAGMTHAEVAASPVVRAHLPALAALAGGIGDAQIRHRGTIGGSIANNDPAACYPSAVLALGARVQTNLRMLDAEAFFAGMFATALEPGEIVTAVHFPACAVACYLKFRNPASRFALVGVFAARLASDEHRIAIIGGGNGVFRWHEAERHLDRGAGVDGLDTVPLDLANFTGDIHGSADYRRHVAKVITRRALTQMA
jgi:aerobic carbon-monoxide dehydrogenase medium subunit